LPDLCQDLGRKVVDPAASQAGERMHVQRRMQKFREAGQKKGVAGFVAS
jgi:hypothetical protein